MFLCFVVNVSTFVPIQFQLFLAKKCGTCEDLPICIVYSSVITVTVYVVTLNELFGSCSMDVFQCTLPGYTLTHFFLHIAGTFRPHKYGIYISYTLSSMCLQNAQMS
jgi:hypothetical protein